MPAPICPICRIGMTPTPERGRWVCAEQPAHVLTIPAGCKYRPTGRTAGMAVVCPCCGSELLGDGQGGLICPNPECGARVTTPASTVALHWHPPAFTGGIGRAPMSNAGDGTRCQALGGIKLGGGSKSGRRRKNKKGTKTNRDYEKWGA